MQLDKYVGRTVEIVYLAQNGQLSQRFIRIRRIHGAFVYAHCLKARQPRTFRCDQILAVMPVIRQAG